MTPPTLLERLLPAAQKARSALEIYKRASLRSCEQEAPKPIRAKAELQCQMVDLLVVVEGELEKLRAGEGRRHAS